MKTILITGANRGIGFGLTEHFLKLGWYVIAGYRSPERSSALLVLQERYPETLLAALCDVSSDESVVRFYQETIKEISALDILVNNAGVLQRGENNIERISPQTLLDTLNINTLGAIRMTQHFLPLIRRGQEKKIINMSSIMGSIQRVSRSTSGGEYSYRISKCALNMFSTDLAMEVRREGILSMAIHPGWVQTQMGGAGATVSVDESVSSLAPFILQASLQEHTGGFFDYQGNILPM